MTPPTSTAARSGHWQDRLRGALGTWWRTHVVADIPPHLNDAANYGLVADKIASNTGHHPAHVRHRLDQFEALLGMDVSPENFHAVYRHYRKFEQANAGQAQSHNHRAADHE